MKAKILSLIAKLVKFELANNPPSGVVYDP